MKDFIDLCIRTESRPQLHVAGKDVRLLHAALGMQTEAGEFTDALKKHLFYGKELDRVNLIEELGDQLWYIAIALDALDTTLDEVMDKVIRKLAVRYPEKFDDVAALDRNLTAERKELEQ